MIGTKRVVSCQEKTAAAANSGLGGSSQQILGASNINAEIALFLLNICSRHVSFFAVITDVSSWQIFPQSTLTALAPFFATNLMLSSPVFCGQVAHIKYDLWRNSLEGNSRVP